MLPGSLILVAFFLNFSLAETQVPEGKLCYILDGVLGMYGIILTILYCRLRMKPTYINTGEYPQDTGRYQKEEGIYVGLTQHGQDTYETIKVQKKAMLV
ncbi:Fc receptor, IgE, high affinity I, gamma polypeptide like isoform X1 [Esox lucius]|uniref:Fc receptor, IgE, high affinity I, gamma polypeptide like n=1 Tax=Esox lucius TaxID=8010 RepID=A0AAY5K3J0_ESOLU|nr:Fc receptor, IgE, high affinity I, gamma polypeptide like isoform X1 [Esox lucius]